jgi:methylmalonyl-CoA/ethylmalonyl-CoA epimerase
MTQFQRIDHIAIATRDARRAADEYIGRFGLVEDGDEVVPAANVRLIFLRPPSGSPDLTQLQFCEPVGPGAMQDHIDEVGEGLHHICFTVDDIHSAVKQFGLGDRGVFLGGRSKLACFLGQRPLGVHIELTETAPR